MVIKITHISDTHTFHNKLKILPCDLLIHTGDFGSRTTPFELNKFLEWCNKQPVDKVIIISGNHDICLDRKWVERKQIEDPVLGFLAEITHEEAIKTLKKYPNIIYLEDQYFIYKGIKIYGSPYTPSFNRQHWAFNADRGSEIKAIWDKIPVDTNILMTHGPAYGILDLIPESYKRTPDEDIHRGCEDLKERITHLKDLKLHCFGHIHDGPTDIFTRGDITYSNGAMLTNDYKIAYTKPRLILF